MSADPIAKLYGGLSYKERAALAFGHMVASNRLEMERITATVPRKEYVLLDQNYVWWLNAFFHLAAFWATEYWQLRCRVTAAAGGSALLNERGDREQADLFAAVHRVLEARLLALDRVLDSFCREHGIAADAVRGFAEAKPFIALGTDVAPDEEYFRMLRAYMNDVVSPDEQ